MIALIVAILPLMWSRASGWSLLRFLILSAEGCPAGNRCSCQLACALFECAELQERANCETSLRIDGAKSSLVRRCGVRSQVSNSQHVSRGTTKYRQTHFAYRDQLFKGLQPIKEPQRTEKAQTEVVRQAEKPLRHVD